MAKPAMATLVGEVALVNLRRAAKKEIKERGGSFWRTTIILNIENFNSF